MSARVYFDNDETTIEPSEGDTTQLGLNLSAGHTGFTGISYDLGGIREICSNGMKGWVSENSFYQDHKEPFRRELAHHAIDSIVEGADSYEQRLKDAQGQTLMNMDEAIILLQETGIGQYLENPTADLINAASSEIEDRDNPTVYEAFQTGTRALEHYSNAPQHVKNRGYDQVSQLLNQNGEMPDMDEYALDVVDDRLNYLVEDQEAEEHWDGEWQALQDIVALRA